METEEPSAFAFILVMMDSHNFMLQTLVKNSNVDNTGRGYEHQYSNSLGFHVVGEMLQAPANFKSRESFNEGGGASPARG